MQMLYDSEAFAVMEIVVPEGEARPAGPPRLARGGYEIVDKFAQTGIWLDGALAEQFREGVEALVAAQPSTDQIDEFISHYTGLSQQPLVLH